MLTSWAPGFKNDKTGSSAESLERLDDLRPRVVLFEYL
jgi:hypothetical protein